MKNMAIVLLLLLSMSAFSQQAGDTQVQKDSINNKIKHGLKLSQAGTDSISAILQWSSASMEKIVKSAVPKAQKMEQIKTIAAERDRKIRGLLSEEQIGKLREIMSAEKEAMKARRNIHR